MVINIQDDILRLRAMGLLERLLQDKTTKGNILWATDAYAHLGDGYNPGEEIRCVRITGENSDIIKTRARRAMEQRTERTRQHAEVFTPLWIVKKMNDFADEQWFGRKTGIYKLTDEGKIYFSKDKHWRLYVDARRLEITCGEAPFLATRYNIETGEAIPIEERVGFLDRKLRAVSENAESLDEWKEWALRAVQATYGYELQGDNLLIARVNVLCTVEEHMFHRWREKADKDWLGKLCNVISWNLWQMDGIKGCVPVIPTPTEEQLSLFELSHGFSDTNLFGEKDEDNIPCRVFDWRWDRGVNYKTLREKGTRNMKFDFIIGNPPYQETVENTSDKPIYNYFMDEAFAIGDKVELITPARFLFNAGKTPKAWNAKMLSDPHFKVLVYEADAKAIFPNNEITGGIAISYRDKTEDYGPIEIFSSFPLFNSIRYKVINHSSFKTIFKTMISSFAFHFTPILHKEHPEVAEIMSEGHANDVTTNVFEKLPHLFFETIPNDGEDYLKMYGRLGATRTSRYIRRAYINSVENIDYYKLYLSKADGAAGTIGKPIPARVIGVPFIAEPKSGATASFFSIGSYSSYGEAENAQKYIQTKFARTMLSVLKITQDATPAKWKFVPLQDFTSASDIDWSKSIHEIDRQLYAKYGLDEAETEFIETHVKELS